MGGISAIKETKMLSMKGNISLPTCLDRCERKYLRPRVSLDGWELEFRVVLVHSFNLLPTRSSENFDDLHQLVHGTLPGEQGLSDQQLRENAAQRPDI